MKYSYFFSLLVVILVGCNLKVGTNNESEKGPHVEATEDSAANVVVAENQFVVNDVATDVTEQQPTKRNSLLPFFKNGIGYYIEKDTAITHRLFGSNKSPDLPFNTRVEVQEVLENDVINQQEFFWVKLKGIDGAFPSFMFSNFKFPYTKDRYSLKRVYSEGYTSGGRTGTKIDPPGSAQDIFGWQKDSLGWRSSKDLIGLSNFDGESGWIIKGVRISSDSLSFNAAVHLFFYCAALYDEGLELQQNFMHSPDVKIWYATYILPPYNKEGFCRVIEKDGYVQILAEDRTVCDQSVHFEYNSFTERIRKALSLGEFTDRNWMDFISGDDFFEVARELFEE